MTQKCYTLIIPRVSFSKSLQPKQNCIYITDVIRRKNTLVFFTEMNPATSLDTCVLLLDWKIWGQKLPTKTHYKEKWANNRSGKKALLNEFCSQVKENNFWFEGSEYFLNFLDYYCHNLSMHWQLVHLSLRWEFPGQYFDHIRGSCLVLKIGLEDTQAFYKLSEVASAVNNV